MSARSLRVPSTGTLNKQSWFDFAIERYGPKKNISRKDCLNIVKTWSEAFFESSVELLSQGISLSLKPAGHLVVTNRVARTVIVPNKGLISVPAGKTVKLRNRASHDNYLKPLGVAKIVSAKVGNISCSVSHDMFKLWVSFLEYAIEIEKRIEIRGFGQFNIHKKSSSTAYNHHLRKHVKTKPKTYLKFSPSKYLSDKLI